MSEERAKRAAELIILRNLSDCPDTEQCRSARTSTIADLIHDQYDDVLAENERMKSDIRVANMAFEARAKVIAQSCKDQRVLREENERLKHEAALLAQSRERIAELEAEHERLKSVECSCGDGLTEGAICANCRAGNEAAYSHLYNKVSELEQQVEAQKLVIDGVAAAVHGWPDVCRNVYAPSQLPQQVAALRADAERYRVARARVIKSSSKVFGIDVFHLLLPYVGETEGGIQERFDAAIDAAKWE